MENELLYPTISTLILYISSLPKSNLQHHRRCQPRENRHHSGRIHNRSSLRRGPRRNPRARAITLTRHRPPRWYWLPIDIVPANSIIVIRRRVVVSGLRGTPRLLDRSEDAEAVPALGIGVWDGPGRVKELVGHGAGVGGVEVQALSVNSDVLEAGDIGDGGEDVGAAVPAAEGGQAPVSGNGSDGGEMVVEGGVGGALERLWDGAAEEEGENLVGGGVGLDLIEGEDDKSVVHEVLIGEERSKELLGPAGGVVDGGIMAVVGHVRGDERPLRELFVLEFRLEVDEALDGA